jgi:hypothetical protein
MKLFGADYSRKINSRKDSRKLYFHKRHGKHLEHQCYIISKTKKNTFRIDYGKLREVVTIENQIRVLSLLELTIVKFCG